MLRGAETEVPMTHGLPQQNTLTGFTIPKAATSPQHGQKPAPPQQRPREPRSSTSRQAH